MRVDLPNGVRFPHVRLLECQGRGRGGHSGATALMSKCDVGLIVSIEPDIWSRMFTDSPTVQAFAHQYFEWVGPWYALFGLCLYFASQGSGKVIGPVLAGTIRLALVAGGGVWLLRTGAPATDLFALVGAAMGVYGLASGLAMYWTSWGPKA